ncbi:MAG: protein arginine kinase [bacterium]|jgi:protein arginine kinase
MLLDDLIHRPVAWLASEGPAGIVVSSRIRLARNIEGLAFPGWAGDEECVRILEQVWGMLQGIECLSPCLPVNLVSLNAVDRDFLRERHLISNDLAQKTQGSGVVIRSDERLSVMVNEEDHLRLQALRPGLQLKELWAEINDLDSQIAQHIHYAFSSSLGYLTACPTNVGTGLRVSAMLHVPGLRLINEIDPIVKGLTKIGLAVRGLQGEGTEASGNMFQISNQMTLGESEPVIIDRLERIVAEVAQHEANARIRLQEQRGAYIEDFVGRAYGVLCHARVLSSREALDMLSALRFGCEFDMIKGLQVAEVNRLVLYSMPGHLQKSEGRIIPPDERDYVRARLVRETVRQASF